MSENYKINDPNIDLVEFYKRERTENISLIMERKNCTPDNARTAVDDSFRDLWEKVSNGKLEIDNLSVPLSRYFRAICLERAKTGDDSDIDIIKKVNRSIKRKENQRRKEIQKITGAGPNIFNNQKDSWKQRDFEKALQEGKVDELMGLWRTFLSQKDKDRLINLVGNLPKPCDKVIWLYYDPVFPFEDAKMKKVVSQLKRDGDDIFKSDNNQRLKIPVLASIAGYKNEDVYKAKKSQCMGKLKKTYFNELEDIFYGQDE